MLHQFKERLQGLIRIQWYELPENPGEILFYACGLIRYWLGLYPEESQKTITADVDLIMKAMLRLLGKKEVKTMPLMSKDSSDKEEEDDGGPGAVEE
jgi:hypothetical protein